MKRTITFRDIDEFLISLGFRRPETEETHWLYVHPRDDCIIVLPGFPLESAVPQRHLVAVRGTLINFGLIDSNESEVTAWWNQKLRIQE